MTLIQIIWLSIIPLTAFWLYALNILDMTANRDLSLILLALGVAMASTGFTKKKMDIDRRYLLLVIPLLLSFIIIPYPYNIGVALLVIGLTGSAISAINLLRPVFLSTIACGLVLLAQSLILIPFFTLTSFTHGGDFLVPSIYGLMEITGLNPTLNHNQLFIHRYYETFSFPATLDKLGLYPFLLILTPILASIVAFAKTAKNALKGVLVIVIFGIIYLVVRYVALAHLFFSTKPVNIAWRKEMLTDPLWILISFIPLILLLIASFTVKIEYYCAKQQLFDIKKEQVFVGTILFISIFFFTSALIFQDPGIPKEGRVLVDERGTLWETSTLKMDKKWYGMGSTYNAYCMIEWINDSYHVDRLVDSDYDKWSIPNATKVKADLVSDLITSDILRKYDILIIKTPKPYHREEIEAIKNFVKNGGGLFLIGDHSNFGGTSTALNEIAKDFDIEFEFDTVNGADNDLSIYVRQWDLLFTKRGLSHPCLRYMPFFEFMTSCSIRTSPFAEQVIRGYALLEEPGDYSTSNFFRLSKTSDAARIWDRNWGLFNQAVAVKYGKGRVVAFADSTTISNFRAFFNGTPNFLVGTMEYLNRSNHYNYLTTLFLVSSIGFALGALYFLRRENRATIMLLAIITGSIAVFVAIVIFAQPIEETIPVEYYFRNHTICFDSEHSTNMIDSATLADSRIKPQFFNVFIIWTQRINLTPFVGNLKECSDRGNAIVIVDPTKEFTLPDKALIKKFLNDGGRVLIMLNESGGPGTRLINEFGLGLEDTKVIKLARNHTNVTLPIKPWGLTILGGEPLKRIGNRVILSRSPYGKGELVVFVPSHVFRDGFNGDPGYMGSIATVPTESNLSYNLKELYDFEFYMFEEIVFR